MRDCSFYRFPSKVFIRQRNAERETLYYVEHLEASIAGYEHPFRSGSSPNGPISTSRHGLYHIVRRTFERSTLSGNSGVVQGFCSVFVDTASGVSLSARITPRQQCLVHEQHVLYHDQCMSRLQSSVRFDSSFMPSLDYSFVRRLHRNRKRYCSDFRATAQE